MAGNLSEMMARVTVNEAEEEVVGYEGEGLENTLLGRVHTDRPYSFQRMKRALTAAWRPRRPISFHELDTNMFLVKLDHFVDLKRVLEDGPWSFQRNLVVLKPIDNDEQPSQQVMTMVPFWIRLINVPLSRRNKSHVGGIASKLGQVMEIDNAYFINRGKHIRARVMINITKPLCRYVTVLNFHNTKVQVHVQYERMPNFCYWCGLLGHTVKECLTMPDEIDWKTFTEWPFQESLRASNSRDDGLLSGIAFSTDVSLSNKDQNDPPKRNNDGLRMVTYHESNDNQNSGRNLCTSYEGYPMSSATMSMGLEPLSNFEDLNHDKPNEGICSDTVKSKYDVQSRSKLESDGFGLDGDKIDCSRGSLNGSQVKFKNTGHVGAEIIAGPDLRQDEIGPEVISHTGRVDNKQCGAIKATQPKVWKKLVQKGLERNLRNETKDETSGGKRPIEDWVGEDIMDVDSVKKLKDNRDFNLTAAATPPTAMSILTWNVQGLGNPWTVQHLRSLVKEYSPTIMFLMETRIQDSETRGFKFIFTHYNMLVVSSTGRAGGLLLFWKKECDLTIQNFSTNHIDFVVKDDDGNSWRGTGIYGWPMQQEKYRTWALLRSLKTNQTQPWICFGDFNEVLYAFEKAGRRGCNNAQMEAFLEACNYCNLSNTSARGVKFTWSNGRRGTGNVKKRLDRFLANEEWLNLFSGAAFHNLARVASDHSPIVSRLLPHVKKKTMFRFENMWLRDESIHEVVNDAWANGVATGLDPCAIIGECAAKLSDWNKYSFGHVQRSIRSKEATLHILQSRFDTSTWLEQQQLREEIKELLTREELMWKQRSRIQWLSEGDKNTRFFHARASNRRKRNSIVRLKDQDGNWIDNEEDVRGLVAHYFNDLFTTLSPQDCDSIVKDIDRSLTQTDVISLEKQVTTTEMTAYSSLELRKRRVADLKAFLRNIAVYQDKQLIMRNQRFRLAQMFSNIYDLEYLNPYWFVKLQVKQNIWGFLRSLVDLKRSSFSRF